VPNEDQERRLKNIISWVQTAKETLPGINEGTRVGVDRVGQMSALLDRLHTSAVALQAEVIQSRRAA